MINGAPTSPAFDMTQLKMATTTHRYIPESALISAFLQAARKVFTTMVGFPIAAQKPVAYQKMTPCGDIASVMPMRCDKIQGQLTLSFTAPVLFAFTSKLIREECAELNGDSLDAAGELTNMITGDSKASLVDLGYDFDMNRPSTYRAEQFSSLQLIGYPRIIVPFHTTAGHFYVDVGFDLP